MALLIVDLDKHIGNAASWRATFHEHLPDLDRARDPSRAKVHDRDGPGVRGAGRRIDQDVGAGRLVDRLAGGGNQTTLVRHIGRVPIGGEGD